MTEIYINTEDEFEIGQTGIGEVHPTPHEEPVLVAIKVIRKANVEEYLEWINEKGLGHMVNRSIYGMNLYLVEVLD